MKLLYKIFFNISNNFGDIEKKVKTRSTCEFELVSPFKIIFGHNGNF